LIVKYVFLGLIKLITLLFTVVNVMLVFINFAMVLTKATLIINLNAKNVKIKKSKKNSFAVYVLKNNFL
jgi:hypothetical protein